jgi:hypothetical protein
MRKLIVTEYMSLDGVMEDPVWIEPYYDFCWEPASVCSKKKTLRR